jgi:hypothetical protein
MTERVAQNQLFSQQLNKYFSDAETHLSYYAVLIKENSQLFCECLLSFLGDESTVLSSSTIAKCLACALSVATQTHNHEYVRQILYSRSVKLPEVLKACEILDSARLYRQLQKKRAHLTNSGKITRLDQQIHNLKVLNDGLGGEVELALTFSLTSSKIKIIREHWVSLIPADKLEFYALMYDLSSWKKLADLMHLKASHFSVPWFLDYAFGKPAPEDSIVSICKNIRTMSASDVEKTILKYKPDYDFLRTVKVPLTDHAKTAIATYTNPNTLLWWLDQFITVPSALDAIVNAANFELPYGVLIDKLFLARSKLTTRASRQINRHTFVVETKLEPNKDSSVYKLYERLLSLAEEKLHTYQLNLESPVAIFGDGSGSMEVAIKTSSIIMSVLCAICNAEMNIFRTGCEPIDNPPKCVNDVIHFNEVTRAKDSTNPAASLAPYYVSGKKLNTIIVVTDEEENQKQMNMNFWEMFDAYCKKLNFVPRVIFISFLTVGNKGQMISEVERRFPHYMENIKQFRFNRGEPDLSKLDSILMLLSK